ncbi:MAG: serine/threonine protein kinase [Thermoguttaceae bacterium]|nr:serine/threonine protein kinase [Thermoguttaceae bacterium]MDW8078819.1 serine/threonine-protein kinase [Thermoguttaceae bacterium]
MSQALTRRLGPYRLISLVYTGATTQLWQAVHEGEHKYYAVKVLLDQFRESREHLRFLRREYEVGRQLLHPRIIRVHKLELGPNAAYLVMEWFPAPSMRSWIQRGLGDLASQIEKIILQATEALAFMHTQGWIHRDVKPDNFLVSPQGEVKLIDFALARRQAGILERLLPFRRRIQGTQSYMSPEQIRGQLLEAASDVYSLGCTFFHLLAGQPPFSGTTTTELLHKHLRAVPPPLERYQPKVNPAFADLVRRMLSKSPKERPRSAQEVLEELNRIPVFR